MDSVEAVEILNANTIENWTVIDSVDKPIRSLVLELNRIGLKTYFSCCGYPYPDEEEPKSHTFKEAFVLFADPIIDPRAVSLFINFCRAAAGCGWRVEKYGNTNQWKVYYGLDDSRKNFYNSLDNKYSIHDFELLAIAIYNLYNTVKRMESFYEEEFEIVDGNAQYEGISDLDWHVKPKKSTIVNLINNYNENETEVPIGLSQN